MNKNEVKKYLKYLKFKKFYGVKYKKCEICSSKKTKLIQKKISWGNNKFGVLPVHCCLNCGFIFQNPRFSKQFYKEYYKKEYLDITKKTQIPTKKYLNDQKFRGNKLFKFLKPYIPKKGTMLDVGSSVGLMLFSFLKNNWTCYGNDPSISFVEYGRNKLGLPIDCLQSEDMKLQKNSLDLIIIMGSLEHVYDVNVVLKKCSNAIKKGGILVLEARGDPLGNSKDFFNINEYKTASLIITTVKLIEESSYELQADLTIKGITHEIKFNADVEIKETAFLAIAKIKIDRTKWDIKYNSGSFFDGLGDYLILDEIEFDVFLLSEK